MISKVITHLELRGEKINQQHWVNAGRNYVIVTNERTYLVKWNDKPFFAAGRLVAGLGPGIGLTIDFQTVENFSKHDDAYILFTWTETDHIYFQTMEGFNKLSKIHTQRNGEVEKVILVQSLLRWI